jgi:hypothetical protein
MYKIEGFQRKVDRGAWPEVFPVCATHKHDFFADYAEAVVRKKERCELCHPRENDSLGG